MEQSPVLEAEWKALLIQNGTIARSRHMVIDTLWHIDTHTEKKYRLTERTSVSSRFEQRVVSSATAQYKSCKLQFFGYILLISFLTL